MSVSFSTVPFTDLARAHANLSLVERRLPAKLLGALPTLLAPLPDPDGALNYLERFLSGDDQRALDETLHYMARHPAALHYALVIFSYSRYLSETLVQQPDLVAWLHRPSKSRQFRRGIEHVKSREDLEEDFTRFEAGASHSDPAVLLARFKRREYLRITVRDVLALASLADTTLELSELADVLLARALHFAEAKLLPLYGEPRCVDAASGRATPARLTLFSLGKLGARELNYNSDIDLLFLYTGDGETAGGTAGSLTNAEYFIRLSHQVLQLVSSVTPEGALFRVDMRLRPRGAEGFLAVSFPSALHYYRTAAREWELQMLIKARPSAGDLEVGRRFLRELHPLVFKPEFNIAAVEAVLNARREMSRSLARRAARAAVPHTESPWDAQWNVKLTPGGIRDIEFLVQCLQRLYGGADPWLAAPAAAATLVALQRLHDKGHITGRAFFELAAAYQFLRVVEHRLQLREGLQRHTLPDPANSAPGALDRLAKRCGVEAEAPRGPGEELQRQIAAHFANVREIYERILVKHRPAPLAPQPAEQTVPRAGEPSALLARLRRDFPAVAAAFAGASSEPLARRGLQRFLSSAIHDAGAMQHLAANPSLVDRAASLFTRSDLAVEVFSRQPADVALLSGGVGQIARAAASDLATLRTNYRHGITRAFAQSLLAPAATGGDAVPFPVLRAQSELAWESIAQALPLVARQSGIKELEDFADTAALGSAPFTVLALGRLGTAEMDIGSDADLVFVADEALTPEEREPWRRLAERLIHTVSSHTREGLLFPVDTRLRPRGQEGDMVQSAAYLREYLQREALAWEAVSWLKALPVGGNVDLGRCFVAQIHEVLAARWGGAKAEGLAGELAQLRVRLEKEGTGPQSRTEFKHIAGGFFDIEYVIGAAYFRSAAAAATSAGALGFASASNTIEQIAALESRGAITPDAARQLRAAATLYRAADHAHRLITGRAFNHMPDQLLGERIARLLGQWQLVVAGPTAEALSMALHEARAATREIYREAFQS